VLVFRCAFAKAPEMFCCLGIPSIVLVLYVPCVTFQSIQGLHDVGTREVPKHVGDCVSVVFIFHCM